MDEQQRKDLRVEMEVRGFGEVIEVSTSLGDALMTACKKCGATVIVNPFMSTPTSPVDVHWQWHQHLGAL